MSTPRITVGMAGLNDLPHVLYRWFDASDVLLYVGITMDLPKRSKRHRSGKPWWTAAAYTTYEHFATRAEAKAAETRAIKEEKPLYNDAENVYVESDDEWAEMLLGQLCGNEGAYNEALAEARARIADLEEDEWDSRNPLRNAIDHKVSRLESDAGFVAHALETLLLQFPIEQFDRCRKSALKQLSEWGEEPTESEVLIRTTWAVATEMADAHLDALDPTEREDWLAVADQLSGRARGSDFTRIFAAGCARHFELTGERPYGLCDGPGRTRIRCATEITTTIWFSDCTVAECAEGCSGHFMFCEYHLAEVLDGQLTREGHTPAPCRYETKTPAVPF